VKEELTVTLVRSLAMHGAHRRDQGHGEQDHGPCSRSGFHAHRFTRFSPPALAPCHANAATLPAKGEVTTQPWSSHLRDLAALLSPRSDTTVENTKSKLPSQRSRSRQSRIHNRTKTQMQDANLRPGNTHAPPVIPRRGRTLASCQPPSKQEQGEQI
jgi:hypothetical protein